MSCDQGNAGNNGGPSGTVGESSDGEEQEESSSSLSDLNPENVNDVLETFRQQWQRELQISPRHRASFAADATKKKNKKKKNGANNTNTNSNGDDDDDDDDDDIENRAKALFLSGVENERTGKLYEAIQFYKRAVQLVPDIEFRLYESTKTKIKTIPRVSHETTHDGYNNTGINAANNLETNNDDDDDDDDDDVTSETDLCARFQRKIGKSRCVCSTQYEQKSTHISCLPMEIILYVLRWVVSADLDVRSLEMCSRVCRGFYVCCRDPEIWRLACAKVWGVNCGPKPHPLYTSWRKMLISRPRVQFNGCYISKTTYIRHGENSFQDHQFYRPWHLVEYYRYLRFFPEGKALMLTTPEEPMHCVALLRYRNPRHTGVLAGHYRLRDNTVTLLVHNSTNHHNRIRNKRAAAAAATATATADYNEQSFQLELQIVSHHKRKHVQLAWLGYSVFTRNRNGTETTSRFDLVGSKFPPLWFSRVKSYTAESDTPLH